MQSHMFLNKIAALKHQRPVPKNSPLSVLNSYVDEDRFIRIRERHRRACLVGAMRNPIVLRAHPLLVLIIQHHHLRMVACRFLINARVIATRILDSPGSRYRSIRFL